MNKKSIRISAVIMSAVMFASGCSSDNSNSSALSESNTSEAPETSAVTSSTTKAEETTSVSTTKAPETTTATTTTTPNETKKPETTTSAVTTKAPETTVVTTTTKGSEWTEEKVSGTKYISEVCYSRKKAIIGAETLNLYQIGDSVKVIAKTNTGYFKLDNGEFIHGDYLSDTKVEPPKEITPEEFDAAMSSKKEETTAPETSNNTNYGKTNSGDEILGYDGDGYAIIGYTPDGQSYIGEGKDEFGEYWIIGYFDGEPMTQYKENGVIGKDDTSLDLS